MPKTSGPPITATVPSDAGLSQAASNDAPAGFQKRCIRIDRIGRERRDAARDDHPLARGEFG